MSSPSSSSGTSTTAVAAAASAGLAQPAFSPTFFTDTWCARAWRRWWRSTRCSTYFRRHLAVSLHCAPLALALFCSYVCGRRYFVLPFLWNRGAVCEVEHRKWKFDSAGFDRPATGATDGKIFDYGSDMPFGLPLLLTTLGKVGWVTAVVASGLPAAWSRQSLGLDHNGQRLYAWIATTGLFWCIMFAGPAGWENLLQSPLELRFTFIASSRIQAFGMLAAGVLVDLTRRWAVLQSWS